jgi:hypothetical protein
MSDAMIAAYPGNVAVTGHRPSPLADRRTALLRLAETRDWLTGREVLAALTRLTPGLGADWPTRRRWWRDFVDAADAAAWIRSRAADAWTAQAVCDELGVEYGADPYGAAMARADDWDRVIDRLVEESQCR